MLSIGLAASLLLTFAPPAADADADPLLDCAADRYRAARALARGRDATELSATKGMGALAPVGRRRVAAARLQAEGDALRRRVGSMLSRSQIAARPAAIGCPSG